MKSGCKMFLSEVVIAYFSIGHSFAEFPDSEKYENLKVAFKSPYPYIYGVLIYGGKLRIVESSLQMVSRITLEVV